MREWWEWNWTTTWRGREICLGIEQKLSHGIEEHGNPLIFTWKSRSIQFLKSLCNSPLERMWKFKIWNFKCFFQRVQISRDGPGNFFRFETKIQTVIRRAGKWELSVHAHRRCFSSLSLYSRSRSLALTCSCAFFGWFIYSELLKSLSQLGGSLDLFI